MNRPSPTIALLLLLTTAYAAGTIGAWGAGRGLETLYPALTKPAWTPPASVFGPVWTILDTMLGLAAWRVWRAEGPKAAAFGFWGTSLGLIALWPWAFFAVGKLGLALGVCLAILLVLTATATSFVRRDRTAAWLVVPAILWVAFASALNLAVLRLNPTPPSAAPRIETVETGM